jgi:signal transduction histidine kinase
MSMAPALPPPPSTAEVDSSLLAVLLSAESVRGGATELLQALAPALDDCPAALAVRDRDGVTLHVLAEAGAPHAWPARLEPQFAVSALPGVDPDSGAMVVPLRANGRVIGALLMGDPSQALAQLHDADLKASLSIAASVLHALASRSEAELQRRALALRSVDAVLDAMAHQMANPLTGASAIAQLLIEDLEDEGQRAAVRQIRQELARAFTVLRDILDFHRDTNAHDGVLDLNTIVERVIRFRGYAIRELGIVFGVEMSPGFMPVRADARGLEQALLIALRHAELQSHGTVNRAIDVRVVARDSREVGVEIRDSGPGNMPELTADYFDLPLAPIEQPARAALTQKPDLGLVDSILRGCGGRLAVTASKADGTTLTLIVPRANTSNLTSQSRMPT